MNPYRRFVALFAVGLIMAVLPGCVGLRGHVRQHAPAGAPSVKEVMADLASNQERLQGFDARGSFVLESPQLTGKLAARGAIYYERPGRLFVKGYHSATLLTAFELTASGTEYLLWVPQDDQAYYSVEGVSLESVPFRVSPTDIVREMFFPEDWAILGRNEVCFEDYDRTEHRATLLIGSEVAPRRRIVVTGTPWMLVRNELLDKEGNVQAVTTYGNQTIDEPSGVRFPRLIEATFPQEGTRLKVDINRLKIDTTFDPGIFDIQEKLSDPQIANLLKRDGS